MKPRDARFGRTMRAKIDFRLLQQLLSQFYLHGSYIEIIGKKKQKGLAKYWRTNGT
jgi:hypothetical protein